MVVDYTINAPSEVATTAHTTLRALPAASFSVGAHSTTAVTAPTIVAAVVPKSSGATSAAPLLAAGLAMLLTTLA